MTTATYGSRALGGSERATTYGMNAGMNAGMSAGAHRASQGALRRGWEWLFGARASRAHSRNHGVLLRALGRFWAIPMTLVFSLGALITLGQRQITIPFDQWERHQSLDYVALALLAITFVIVGGMDVTLLNSAVEVRDARTRGIDVSKDPTLRWARARIWIISLVDSATFMAMAYQLEKPPAFAVDPTGAAVAWGFIAARALVAPLANVKFARPTHHLIPEGMPGYNPDLRGVDGTASLAGDPQQALALATQYAAERCGGSLSNCPPVALSVAAGYLIEANAALTQWRQALPGYPLSLEQISRSNAPGHPAQLLAIGVTPDYPDPQNLLSLSFTPDAPFNLGHVDDPAVTALLRQADADQDAARRISEYQQAEQLLVDAVAWIPIEQDQAADAVRADLQGYHETALLQPTLATWTQVYVTQTQETQAVIAPENSPDHYDPATIIPDRHADRWRTRVQSN